MNKEKINLVWLKRDLRLHDNEAISKAIKNGKRFLIFYAFEKKAIRRCVARRGRSRLRTCPGNRLVKPDIPGRRA